MEKKKLSDIFRTKQEKYSVYSEFDIEKHKETFIHYLEVVINSDGRIEYAVPSHCEKMISIICEKECKSRDDVIKSISIADDYPKSLCNRSGCISVWEDYAIYPDEITDAQIDQLINLIHNKLYFGKVPQCLKINYMSK